MRSLRDPHPSTKVDDPQKAVFRVDDDAGTRGQPCVTRVEVVGLRGGRVKCEKACRRAERVEENAGGEGRGLQREQGESWMKADGEAVRARVSIGRVGGKGLLGGRTRRNW